MDIYSDFVVMATRPHNNTRMLPDQQTATRFVGRWCGATWTPPTVKQSRCVTRGIRLQLYIRSAKWAFRCPDQDEYSLETASFVRRSFRSPASTGFDFLGL